MLIQNGAIVDAVGNRMYTPSLYAIKFGNFRNLQNYSLSSAKGQIDSNTSKQESLFLTRTLFYPGHEKIVELLIQKGANVEYKTKNGWALLHFSAERGNLDIFKISCIQLTVNY